MTQTQAQPQAPVTPAVETKTAAPPVQPPQAPKPADPGLVPAQAVAKAEAVKESKTVKAQRQLSEITKVVSGKSEDVLHSDYGFNRIHAQLFQEMADRKQAGKEVHMSDGTMEMIDLNHARLKKAQKI